MAKGRVILTMGILVRHVIGITELVVVKRDYLARCVEGVDGC